MDLSQIPNVNAGPPASDGDIESAERGLGTALPPSLARVLRQSDGCSGRDTSLNFYSTMDLPERNATLETRIYATGFVAIADDGGGRVALLRVDGPDEVYVSDAGDMDPGGFVSVADGLDTWIAAGCSFGLNLPRSEPAAHASVDVFLLRLPDGGLKGLSRIRMAFGLPVSLSDLKKRAETLPCHLVQGLTYAVFQKTRKELGDLGKDLEARAAEVHK